jgi:diaminopimelate decarboxylase
MSAILVRRTATSGLRGAAVDSFHLRGGELLAEECSLEEIAARFGTPCFVYSRAGIERGWRAFDDALAGRPHLLCYAVKANANLAVLEVLAGLGSGFDIVSVGELERVLAAGGDPGKVVFSGVGKSEAEIERALQVGIACFNVESAPELERIQHIASRLGRVAPISLRVNPDVDAGTHPYIATGLRGNKFGVPAEQAVDLYRRAAQLSHLAPLGMDCHIGSQLTSLAPFLDAFERLLKLIDHLADAGITLRHLDVGGGLGIRYADETPPTPAAYVAALCEMVGNRKLELLLEPGRSIVGEAGVLLTRIDFLKHGAERRFAIVDAAMNDLLRPSLYGAWQGIVPVSPRSVGKFHSYDVVGPVCETGDFLGRDRELRVAAGDLLAVRSAGAYGFVMSSNYNARPRAAEVMVDGDRALLVRRRESLSDLLRGEYRLTDAPNAGPAA